MTRKQTKADAARKANSSLRSDLRQILLVRQKQLGWTQQQWAAACGMSQPAIASFMNGTWNVSTDTVERMAKPLGVQFVVGVRLVDVPQSSQHEPQQ